MIPPIRQIRRYFRRLLEDSEDEIEDEFVPELPMPDPHSPASLDSIQNNHLYHLTQGFNMLARGHNGSILRIGRLEAKVGFILLLAMTLVGFAIAPIVQSLLGG